LLPYGVSPPRPIKLPPKDFPDSIACMARYCRMDSGIASQSSPVSMLFLAKSFIFARLFHVSTALEPVSHASNIPILEPNLHGSLRHVDILRNTFSNGSCWRWVLVEFHLQSDQLVLGRPLSLLVLLLLCKGALPRRSARGRVDAICGGCGRGWCVGHLDRSLVLRHLVHHVHDRGLCVRMRSGRVGGQMAVLGVGTNFEGFWIESGMIRFERRALLSRG
jgi:hypothetical protein